MTVEAVAAALGISRAFAYEAVTRNEIQSGDTSGQSPREVIKCPG